MLSELKVCGKDGDAADLHPVTGSDRSNHFAKLAGGSDALEKAAQDALQSGNHRWAVELAKEWRTDRRLRNLDALMLVADCDHMLLVTGVGDVVEPDDGVLAVGSGSRAATAAARALLANTDLDAEAIATKAMELAAQLDVYTNERWITETLTSQ